jgi:hypothetical protein
MSDAPVLEFTSGILDPETLENVVLKWSKQVYNGKYYLYKMNHQGNWVKLKPFKPMTLKLKLH